MKRTLSAFAEAGLVLDAGIVTNYGQCPNENVRQV